MRVNIYHINESRDKNHKRYSIYQNGDVVDPSIYDEVFSAELDTSNLEEIHRMMKFEGHPLMRGANVTVSDVVVVNGRAHVSLADLRKSHLMRVKLRNRITSCE